MMCDQRDIHWLGNGLVSFPIPSALPLFYQDTHLPVAPVHSVPWVLFTVLALLFLSPPLFLILTSSVYSETKQDFPQYLEL